MQQSALTALIVLWMALIAVAAPPKEAAMAIKMIATCNATYPVSKEMMATALKNNGTLPDESNETARCFIQCMQREEGNIFPNGTYNTLRAANFAARMDAALGKDNADTITQAFTSCSARSGTGNCMTVYLIRKCQIETLAKLWGPFIPETS